jgi:hypothetical protein
MTASTYPSGVDLDGPTNDAGSGGVAASAAVPLSDFATGRSLAGLPARELTQTELLELVASIASDPESWGADVAFDDDERHYVCLYRDSHVDVWLLCWTPQNDTGWHDHDISSGSVAVVQGRLVEHRLAVGSQASATTVGAGRVFSFGPDHIHRLVGRDARSVSVHAYSPPLWRMGQYAVGATGVLRRTSVSYADELRPLDETGAAVGSPG